MQFFAHPAEYGRSADSHGGFADTLQRRDPVVDEGCLGFVIEILRQAGTHRSRYTGVLCRVNKGAGIGLVVGPIVTDLNRGIVLYQ